VLKSRGWGFPIRNFRLHRRAIFILFVVATLPYLPLLGGVYLFDDIQLIENNYTLKGVRNLSDVFTFVLKPSKPVSNFVLALGQWWGRGSPFHHRLLTLLIHAAAVLLLYANLYLLRRRLRPALPRRFAFWVAFLFALTPVHTEAVGVTWFRMDMLGALFTLSGMWAAQQIGFSRRKGFWYGVLFFSLGLGTLSKEIFAVVLPVCVLAVGWVTRGFGWRQALAVVGMQSIWAGLLGWLLTKDAKSEYPYDEVVGWGIIELPLQIRLSASAFIEGLYKTFSGHGLTIVRLQERFGVGIGLGVEGALAFFALVALLLGWLVYRGGFLRAWAIIFAASAGIYVVIPNLNIGSEHYWYLSSAAAFVLLVYGLFRVVSRFSLRPASFVALGVLVYGIALGMGLESRVARMISRERFYRSEWKAHPEAVGTWSDMATVLMEAGKLEESRKFLDQAKKMDPTHPNVLIGEFLHAFHSKDLKKSREAFTRIQEGFKGRPHMMALFHFHLGMLEEKQVSPAAAARSYLKALEIEPHVKFYREIYEKNAALAKAQSLR